MSRRSTIVLSSAGLALLAVYGAVAWVNGFFIFSEFDYLRDKAVVLFSFRQAQLASMFWKAALLLPATILLAAALVRSGVRLHLPPLNRAWTILSILMIAAGLLMVLSIATVFRQTEVTDDENAYVFQARTLLLGRTANPPPPAQKSFDNVFLINDGRQWVGKYGLGHPAVVALGLLVGSRYAVTVLISILMIPLVYLIAGRLDWDRRTAIVAAGLIAISPFYYLVSSSLLSHTTAAFALGLVFLLLVIARRRAGQPAGLLAAFAGGLALGLAFNVRPLTAIGYGLPFGLLLVADAIRQRRSALALIAASGGGLAIAIGVTLWYNQGVTGSAFTFPFNYYNAEEAMGFGVYGHTPVMALSNMAVSFIRLNAFLFGFPLSLMFAAIPFAFRLTEGDKLAAGIVGSLSAAYLLYWAPGVSDVGPVYYYEMLVPLVLLSARGVMVSHEWVLRRFPTHAGFVPAFLAVSTVVALLTFVPERLIHVRRLTDEIREPYEAIEAAGLSNALVFVRSIPNKGWVFGYRHPDPSLNENVILCAFADRTSNLAAVDAFPDRDYYVMWYDAQWQRSAVRRVTRADLMALPPRKQQ